MSLTKEYIMRHYEELRPVEDYNEAYYEYLTERKKQEEEEWYEWAENNRFTLADGTILDGEQLKTA